MNKKVFCEFNVGGAHCSNQQVKRSLFGFGARCCSEFYGKDGSCNYRRAKKVPISPPPKGTQ